MTDRDSKAREVQLLLSRHALPGPDDDLRRQVLEAAKRVVEISAPPTLSERIWLSRTWRLGWAAALVLLLLGQFVMASSAERSARRLLGPPAGSTRPSDGPARSMAEMAARELGLELGGSMALAASSPRSRPHQPLTELPPEE